MSSRRSFLQSTAAAMASGVGGVIGLCPARGLAAGGKTVRIGYQKSSTLATLLKAEGALDQKLAPLGLTADWHEFSSGLPLLEALNVGSLDFSADVADTVPVFALAAGARLVDVALEAPSPAAQAVLAPEGSAITTVAALRGKKIAVTKAAGAHYLLIALLAKAGLGFGDITPAYLTPADGRAAFERGAVDAWVTWDPFAAAAQRQSRARVLADGSGGVAGYRRYYLASTDFVAAQPAAVDAIYAELARMGLWTRQNPQAAARALAPLWGLDAPTVLAANARRSYDVRPVTPDALAEQQKIADAFFDAGLLPRRVNVSNVALWKPPA